MSDRELKDRNKNPWYILMTLHGEQEGGVIDWDLAGKNRRLWNAWACQGMAEEQRHAIADRIGIDRGETEWTDAVAQEVVTLFHKAWKARNEAGVNAPDIPDPEIGGNLSEMDFSNTVVLEKSIFETTDFGGAHFGKTTHFRGAHFGGTTDFGGAHFGETTHFRDAHFGKTTHFRDAHFGKRTIFHGAHFGETTYFRGAHFGKRTDFHGAHFGETTYFHGAHFGKTTNFRDAQFKGFCYFTQARFGARAEGQMAEVDFSNAVFGGPTSFEGARFASHLPKLSGVTLHDTTTVTAKQENWPEFGPSILSKLDIFLRLKRPPDAALLQDPAVAKASAAKLRHVMAKQALPEEEHFFFRREMHHAARAEPFWRTAHIYAYEALSNFGYSIMRPLGWIALVWAIGAWLYAIKAAMGWGTGAAYSFATMFKFFGFQRTFLLEETRSLETVPWMETFAVGQTVVGFILLFFLGLGLRTRFRLR